MKRLSLGRKFVKVMKKRYASVERLISLGFVLNVIRFINRLDKDYVKKAK